MKSVSNRIEILLENSQPKPSFTKEEYRKMSRTDRMYYAMIYPRFFKLSATDDEYLEMLKMAYNIMCDCGERDHNGPTGAKYLIKHMMPGEALKLDQVHALMRDAKAFFGKMVVTDTDFDRHILRQRLWDLADRAKTNKDLFEERLALAELVKLDGLATKAKKDNNPVIPELPPIEYTENFNDAAIILESPEEEDMDQ